MRVLHIASPQLSFASAIFLCAAGINGQLMRKNHIMSERKESTVHRHSLKIHTISVGLNLRREVRQAIQALPVAKAKISQRSLTDDQPDKLLDADLNIAVADALIAFDMMKLLGFKNMIAN